MVAARLDVRLDPEHRQKLEEISVMRGASVSEVVRDLIDRAYEEVDLAARRAAADRIGNLQVEDMPDPAELTRQLQDKYGSADLP
jgi:predicted DNA-binding protein